MLPVGLYQGEKQKKKTEKKTAATTTSKAQQESTLIQGQIHIFGNNVCFLMRIFKR